MNFEAGTLLNPLGDRISVLVDKEITTTKGGILIPTTAQEKTSTGIVTTIPDDCGIDIALGDHVLFDKFAGTSLQIGDNEVLLLHDTDIIATIEESGHGA